MFTRGEQVSGEHLEARFKGAGGSPPVAYQTLKIMSSPPTTPMTRAADFRSEPSTEPLAKRVSPEGASIHVFISRLH
jgi:hypothetical protein